MSRNFILSKLDGAHYGYPWLELYIESLDVFREESKYMFCKVHGLNGAVCNDRFICCDFEQIRTRQFEIELMEKQDLLDKCKYGKIAAVLNLNLQVEAVVNSAEVDTWNDRGEKIAMRFFR